MVPATAPPALSSAALLTALAARARSSDASLAGDAGVLTFAAAAAGAAGAFLAAAGAFLAGAEGYFAAAFLTGEAAAATAFATPAAAAERLEAGRLDAVGVDGAFLAGVGAFFEGVVEEAFFTGDWRREGGERERKGGGKGGKEGEARESERGGGGGRCVRETEEVEREKNGGGGRSTKEEGKKNARANNGRFRIAFLAEEGVEVRFSMPRRTERVS